MATPQQLSRAARPGTSSVVSPSLAVNGDGWTPVGPKPIYGVGTSGNTVGIYGPTSGRTTALALDPTNAATIYAGTAGGGVWKTTDSGTTWNPLTDTQSSLAIGGLAVDSTGQNIFAGTGEDNRCADCQFGQGILMSADGGGSWTIAGPSGFQTGPIALPGNTPFVGTDAGLYVIGSNGGPWTAITSLNSLTPTVGKIDALFVDPNTQGRMWASVNEGCQGSGFIAVSSDSGSTWAINKRMSSIAGLPKIERIALAEGPGGVLYAALAACNSTSPSYAVGQFVSILKSTDSGASWTVIRPNASIGLTDYFSAGNGAPDQGDYDNVVAVNPHNANQAVFGGVTMLATSDGGLTFTDIARPYSGGPVHPDFHAAVFSASGGTLIVGNDGGVYSTTNLGTTWSNLSATLAVTTFYSGAALDANHIVGGAQDEGTSGLLPGGPTPPAWRELLGSDGGNVSLDPNSTAMYAEVPFGTIARGSTTYNDASPGWQLASPCAAQSDPACNEPVSFTAPFAVNWGTNTIFTATNRVYRSTTGGTPPGSAGWSAISGDLTTGTGINPNGDWITAMAYLAPDTLVVGSYGGDVWITQNARASPPSWTNLTSGLLPFDPNAYTGRPWITSLAISGTQVWATVGTGARYGRVARTSLPPAPTSWTFVDGSLPSLPINSIVLDPASSGTVYVGTDAGAYLCGDCSGAPTYVGTWPWALIGSGLPNAQIDTIAMQQDSNAIVVFTHGRGAYTLPHRTSFSASPASVDFGYGTVGTTGPDTQVMVTATGVTPSTALSASITGPNASDFSYQTANFSPANCAGMARLVPEATCQLVLNFNPGAEGTRTATLTLIDAQGGSLAVPLTGIGSHPVVSLSPTSVSFGSLNVGATSAQQQVFVKNTGQGPLTVSLVTTSGDFDHDSLCYLVVSGGQQCWIYVWFSPTATGTRTGTLTITDNAAGSPHTVPLSGVGTRPVVSLSTTSIVFADQPYPAPTAGPMIPVTVTNTGTGPLTIQRADSSTADFIAYTCANPTVLPNQSCTINVAFTPTSVGFHQATLTIIDDASPNQQTVSLQGTAVAAPYASFDPSPTYFGIVNIGTTAGPSAVTLTNRGTATLTITAISIVSTVSGQTAEYTQTNNCPPSLAVNQNCTIQVTFSPTYQGNDYAAISVSDNEANSPQQVGLYGDGEAVGVSLQPPTPLSFGSQVEGSTSATQTVSLQKTGNGKLIISRIWSNSKDFGVTTDCPSTTIVDFTICHIYVQFTPTTTGALSGNILISDNATDGSSPQSIGVSGTGTPGPLVTASPSSLTFPFTPMPGTASAPKTITITNGGQAPLTIGSIATTIDFPETNTCPAQLAAGASCTATVTFKPTTFGDLSGQLTLVDNAPDSPQTVPLSGTTNLVMTSGPAVSSWGVGRLDIFAVGPDGALWHKYYASSVGWQGWSSLGAPPTVQLASQPGVVSWANGRIDVFIRGSDNALWHKFYDATSGGWSAWYSHGGTLMSAPSATTWGYGRLDIFAKGSGGDLQHIFYSSATGWSTWYSHGGQLTSSPAAVSWGNGRIDVFARGTANDVQHIYYDVALNGWSTWYSHGGTLAGAPAASSWGRGRLDLFATSSQGIVQHSFYDSSMGGWNPWGTLAGQSSADPGAISWGPGRIDIFTRGLDNVLWHEYFAGGVWSYWYRG